MTGPVTLLIVEDDDGHATLLRRHLRRSGLNIDMVRLRDGQELLDYLARRGAWADRLPVRSLAMVLDLNMPRLGGAEVLERLSADASLLRIPVFVLTTTDNSAELDRCYALGASICLIKPVDYGAFGAVVQHLGAVLTNAWLPDERPAHDHVR